MQYIKTEESIDLIEGVDVEVKSRTVKVKGAHGELEHSFKHLPLEVTVADGKLTATLYLGTPLQKAAVRTFCSHVSNMMKGVAKRFQYKMRLVYNHFPININITENGTVVEIRNFLGERRTRVVRLRPGVVCVRSTNVKDELVLTGISIENVAQSCALIYQNALVRKKDIRQFLDGIYVSEKGLVEA